MITKSYIGPSWATVVISISLQFIAINGYVVGNGDVSRKNNKDKARKSVFMDCGARYRIGRIDAEVSARNLTNDHQYSYSYVHDSDIYAYSFRLRPMEVLMSLWYSF